MAILGAGQVAITVTAIYTVPDGKVANIQLINFCHTGTATTSQEIKIYVKDYGGTQRQVFNNSEFISKMSIWMPDLAAVKLTPGDVVLASTTTATLVDYTVFGEEVG